MIAKAMIKKVALPGDVLCARQEFLPVREGGLQTGFAREGKDGVQMIWHEQHQAAMPDEAPVVVRGGGQHSVACPGPTKMVLAAGSQLMVMKKKLFSATHCGTSCGRRLRTGRSMHRS